MGRMDTVAVAALPVINGTTLRLQPWRWSDLDALLAIFGDARVERFLSIARLQHHKDALAFLDGIEQGARERSLLQWAIARNEDDAVVGSCTLAAIDWAHQRAEVGFAVAPAYWRSGVMREVLPLLIAHAFDSLGLQRLEADVDPENIASLQLLERNGFQREGLLRRRYLKHGAWQDSLLLGLLR